MVAKAKIICCLIAFALSTPAVQALTADQIVSNLQKQWPVQISGHASVLAPGNEVITTVTLTQAVPNAELLKFAAQLASHLMSDGSNVSRLLVLFQETTVPEKIRSVTISNAEWQSIKDKSNPETQLSIVEGGRADGMFVASLPARPMPSTAVPGIAGTAQADTTGMKEFETERVALIGRLELLQKKGTGTALYTALLQQCEEAAKAGKVQDAKEGLARLSEGVKDQEKQLASRSTMRLKTGVSQSVVYQPPQARPQTGAVSATGKAQAPQGDLLSALLDNRSIADFKGSEKQAGEELARLVLGKVFGKDAPEDGPFLVERLRIARRIQELENQKINAMPYRVYMRDKIEYYVKLKDPRALNMLADNIKYLEAQIGLEILKSDKKKKKS